MIRKLLVLLLIISIPSSALLFANTDEEPLIFTVTIPLDYGVTVPEDAIMLDKFAVSVVTAQGVQSLVREDTFYVGTISEAQPGSMDFVLLYYGNLPYSYDADITVDAGIGWYMYKDDEIFTIPIAVGYYIPDNLDPSVSVGVEHEGSIPIHIKPDGPKNGMPILGIELSWEGIRDIVPGDYQADIDIRVDVL